MPPRSRVIAIEAMRYSGAVPTVDVIIPAFNAEKFLVQALESVIAQDFGDWRILLVDDGSTDSTAEIAARYGRRLGDRLLVITQPNAGLSAARNAALRAASAEFLAILDADDLWLPCRLTETLKAFAGRPEVGLSYGLVNRIDENGCVFAVFAGNPGQAEGRIAQAIYMRRVDLPCPTVTIRRSLAKEVGFFDETMRATEDRDYWLRVALLAEVAFIPKVIASYRSSPNSMSTDMDRMLSAQLRFLSKHTSAPGCGRRARRIATARIYKQRGEVYSERGHRWQAVGSALHACWLWPVGIDNLRSAGSLFVRAVRRR